MDILLLQVDRACNEVWVNKSLIQFVSLKVIEDVFNKSECHSDCQVKILLHLEDLPDLMLPKVNTDQTLSLSLLLVFIVQLNDFREVLLSCHRVLERLNKHHLKSNVGCGVLKAFRDDFTLVVVVNLLNLLRPSQFEVARHQLRLRNDP